MALPIIAAAAAVVGAGISMYGSVQQGKAAEEAGRAQRNINERNAIQIENQGKEEEKLLRKNSRRQLGEMRTDYGASGVTLEGSPLDWMVDSAMAAERDALNIKFTAQDRAQSMRLGGQYAFEEGQSKKKAYTWQAIGTGVSAAGSMAGKSG